MNPPQEPPQPRIWQLALGFATTTVLSALVKAGVIEQLGEQPKKLPELVQACGLNADVLSRTLRFAAVIDVVTLNGEQYALTDVGRLLLKDVPGSLSMFLLLMGSEPWRDAMAERVEIQPGNFFERVPGYDVLLLKHVLHDWSDEKCQVILSHCREAMQPSSRLLIVEMVIPSPPDLTGAFYDLHMQVLQGGRERTENEFRLLLQKEGLKLKRMIATKSPMKIIEASL